MYFFSPLHFDLHEYRYCLSFLTTDLKAKISQNFGNEHSSVCIRHCSVLETTFKFKSVSTLNEYFWISSIFLLFITSSNFFLCTQQSEINNSDTEKSDQPLKRHSHNTIPWCTLQFSLTLLCALHPAGGGLTSPSQNHSSFQAFGCWTIWFSFHLFTIQELFRHCPMIKTFTGQCI